MFSENLDDSIIKKWRDISLEKGSADVSHAISSDSIGFSEMAALLSPEGENHLEEMACRARSITSRRFGKTILLYTPIYLSNYCEGRCLYCGFRKESRVIRRFQQPEDVLKEALYLKSLGFRNILLVSGDDPNVSMEYLVAVLSMLHKVFPSISVEIPPKSIEDYMSLRLAGADGVVVYQETYRRESYETYHPSGEKSDYILRLDTPDRVAKAGFHRVGIGCLIGLDDFRYDVLALFAHVKYLIKHRWQTQVTVSLPRMQKAKDSIDAPNPVDDKKFIQLICALRIALPDIGIVLSTREAPRLRDGLVNIAVTQISAGSCTEPGGYLFPDERGRQFHVQDTRSPKEIENTLKDMGFDPVWKDWEGILNDTP